MNITKKDLSFITITEILLIIKNKEYLKLDRDKSTFKSHRDFCF